MRIHTSSRLLLQPSAHPRLKGASGFALIATISVMVLLVMVALAMLSLSTIELRASRQGDAMAEARANARLALMMAIGELQKEAGPDQRITATGGITSNSAQHRHVAGVWGSWRPEPFSPSSNYDTTKDGKFRRWLVSHKDTAALERSTFAANGSLSDPVELLGRGTLGSTASSNDFVRAGKISVTSGRRGVLAWGVMDDGVKARVNMPLQEHTGSLAERSGNLGAASRVGFEKVETGYNPDTSQTQKIVTLDSGSIELSKSLGERTHDLTVWSQGPMTNVVDGGLREDLNLICDRTSLPASFANARVYSGSATPLHDADPYWQQIFEYASLYKSMSNVNGLPQVAARVPVGYTPIAWNPTVGGMAAKKTPPKGMILMPSIAKVQVIFSLVARRAHFGWTSHVPSFTRDPKRNYLLHLVYSPVITLHNPYNVAIKFDKLRLVFHNVPIGFRFSRNDQLQTYNFAPLNWLYTSSINRPNASKSFQITLQNEAPSGGLGGAVTLSPGEVKIFSPYFRPGYTWQQELNAGDGVNYFDWQNRNTASGIDAVPGWRGEGIGYDADWLTPQHAVRTPQDDQMGVLSLRLEDRVKVEYKPMPSIASKNKFTINTNIYVGNRWLRAGVIEMDYKDSKTLSDLLPAPDGKPYQHPQPGERSVTCEEIYETADTPISGYDKAQAFCMFSAYAKTTSGGAPKDHVDGRYATKAWSFSNPNSNVSSSNLADEHGSHHSHEMNFESLPGAADDWVQVDGDNRGYFITGHTAFKGLTLGTHNELPITPIQSVSNLQNANLASSGYLPRFDYPLANSFAHPLMSAGSVRENGINGELMLDHSFLLNHNLYDRFYCSTVANYQGGMFGASGRSTQTVFEDFLSGKKNLLDQRFVPYQYAGKSVTAAVTEVVGTSAGSNGYKKVAAYQMLQGEWNVNSVSVEAWKAVLAGLHHTDFPIYDALQKTIKNQVHVQTPMSRFRLPNAGYERGSGSSDESKRARWAGYRELSDDELTVLAEEIVKQVRERGPFLSLSEFVNRRLSGSQEQQLSGALQAAIDATPINNILLQDGRNIAANDISGYKYRNPAAALGNSTQGAPGSITQGHILNAIGNAVTVRSNTFTIRAYGESVDNNGNVLARSWCEAVVQRVPEYMDHRDDPHVKTDDLTSQVNRNFGRRFRIVNFRWLNDEEV